MSLPESLARWSLACTLALVLVLPVSGYVLNNHQWPGTSTTYYINPVNGDGIAAADVIASIRQGAENWHTQSRANFEFIYSGTTTGTTLGLVGKNEVFFRAASSGSVIAETLWTYDGSGRLVDADIVIYDEGLTFLPDNASCVGGYYLQDVLTHEFGHCLTMGHSADTSATMYYATAACSTSMRTLAADDIAGIEAIYPPAGSSAPRPAFGVKVK